MALLPGLYSPVDIDSTYETRHTNQDLAGLFFAPTRRFRYH